MTLDEFAKLPDLFTQQYDQWKRNRKRFNDNRSDLYDLFEIEEGDQHATGFVFRCKRCVAKSLVDSDGKVGWAPSARVIEEWMDCKNAFVPQSVRCPNCHTRWDLKITDKRKKQTKECNCHEEDGS